MLGDPAFADDEPQTMLGAADSPPQTLLCAAERLFKTISQIGQEIASDIEKQTAKQTMLIDGNRICASSNFSGCGTSEWVFALIQGATGCGPISHMYACETDKNSQLALQQVVPSHGQVHVFQDVLEFLAKEDQKILKDLISSRADPEAIISQVQQSRWVQQAYCLKHRDLCHCDFDESVDIDTSGSPCKDWSCANQGDR